MATTRRPTGPATRLDDAPLSERLGPHLRAEFDELVKHERKVLTALKDPKTAEAFLADPGQVLRRLGVPLGPITAKRLKAADTPASLTQRRFFQMPTGDVVSANVRVSFTGARTGDQPHPKPALRATDTAVSTRARKGASNGR